MKTFNNLLRFFLGILIAFSGYQQILTLVKRTIYARCHGFCYKPFEYWRSLYY
jgi:hypothetical protein